MIRQAIIVQGKTRTERIPADQFHSGAVIEWQPMTKIERSVTIATISFHQGRDGSEAEIIAGVKAAERAAATAIVKHVKSWDIVGDDGEVLPITLENAFKLQPNLEAQIFNLVAALHHSYAPADEDNDSVAVGSHAGDATEV